MSAALVVAGRRGVEKARQLWARRNARRSLLVVAAVLQVFVLISAVAWWTSSPSAATTTAQAAPATWVGVVHDVGAAGVNLRASPAVLPNSSRDTAARGSRLPIVCAQNGDVVSSGTTNTRVWLKTTDDMWVSLLYVRVSGKSTIASCANDQQNTPLIAISDPANPAPAGVAAAPVAGGTSSATGCPEDATCQASGAGESPASNGSRVAGGATRASGGAGPGVAAPAGRPLAGSAPVGTGKASAAVPAGVPSAPGSSAPNAGGGAPKAAATPTPSAPSAQTAVRHGAADPDVTPVG